MWQSIETAPSDRDLELSVIDHWQATKGGKQTHAILPTFVVCLNGRGASPFAFLQCPQN
jgi:hypothetical protein